MRKILFLAANPQGTSPLQLDKELRKIEDSLQRSKLRDQFQLVSKWAVDSTSLRQALLAEEPDIVHFSGHGEGKAGLVLMGQDDQPKPATADALSTLFSLFPTVKCVLLNACYAEEQAKAIVEHVDCVIGMKQAVRDDAAIAFAAGFYDGLGYGKPVDVAFKLGCVAIQFELASFSDTTRKLIPVDLGNLEKIESLADHLIPILLSKAKGQQTSPDQVTPNTIPAGSLSEQLRTTTDINEGEAIQRYRERVKEFLEDGELTPLEKIQLATLANVLGISEEKANEILEEVLAPVLTELYEKAHRYYQSQKWQRVLDVFRGIEAFNTTYPDPENLKTLARQQLIAQERRQQERKLADLYHQACQFTDNGEWQESLRILERVQHIQPDYQETVALMEKVKRVISAEQNMKLSIGLIVAGWVASGLIGSIPGNPYASFSLKMLAGWVGGCISGISVPLVLLHIENASSQQKLHLLGCGIAGSIIGGLLWWIIYLLASPSQYASTSQNSIIVMIQVILSIVISIGALLVWRNWIRSNGIVNLN